VRRCDTCGKRLRPWSWRDFKWRNLFSKMFCSGRCAGIYLTAVPPSPGAEEKT
jgi:hypothetical protein